MANSLWFTVKKIKLLVSLPLVANQLKILVVILALVLSTNVSKFKALDSRLSLSTKEAPVIIHKITSPTPPPLPSAVSQIQAKIQPKKQEASSTVSRSSNPLCKGVTEPWAMIPDPSHEGEYVICNVTSEKMATVDELNAAQNDYRASHGLNKLAIDSQLCTVAAQRAKEIAANFSHDGFEAAIERNGVNKSAIGENIASGPLSGVHFVQWAWDRSPGHKSNMLGDWSIGCGGVWDRFAVFIFAK